MAERFSREQLRAGLAAAEAAGDAAAVADLRQRLSAVEGPQGFSLRQTLSNVPRSARQFAGDIGQAVLNPIDTISGAGKVVAGGIEKLIPGRQPDEPAAEAFGGYLKDRYGGVDALKRTVQEDPVGALSDISGVLTGGATAFPKTLGRLGKVGAAIDPINAVTKPTRGLARAASRRGMGPQPVDLMQSTSKFGTTYSPLERRQMAQFMVDNEILPNQRGVEKLSAMQETLGNTIDQLIEQARLTGQSVPLSALEQSIPDVIKNLGGPTLEAADDVAVVRSIVKDYKDEMLARGITRLNAADLQKFKTDAYKRIDFDRSQQKASIPKEQAYKAMARDARAEIERMAPEIAPVNEQYGAVKRTREGVERAANRIANRDIVGIGEPIKATAGTFAGGPGVVAGAALGALDRPLIKGRTALAIDRFQKAPIVGKKDQAKVLLRALAAQAGRAQDYLEE